MSSVAEAIRAGRYENKVPHDITAEPVNEDTMTVRRAREHKEEQKKRQREQRDLNQTEYRRLRDLLKADLEAEYNLSGHPKAEKLFAMAWEDGHSGGYQEVARRYDELVELVQP